MKTKNKLFCAGAPSFIPIFSVHDIMDLFITVIIPVIGASGIELLIWTLIKFGFKKRIHFSFYVILFFVLIYIFNLFGVNTMFQCSTKF